MFGLSNREIAIPIWSIMGIVFAIRKQPVREALGACHRAFRNAKVWSTFVLFAFYIIACTAAASIIGLWNSALLKDSVLWFFFSGFVLLLNAVDGAKKPQFFRQTLRGLVSISATFIFIVNLESFTLPVELVLQPLSFGIMMCILVSQTEEKYRTVHNLLVTIMTLIICGTMYNTIRILAHERNNIDYGNVTKLFALPVWLTLVAIPIVFLFALIATYEDVIVRMSFRARDRSVPFHSKFALILTQKWRIHNLRAMDAKAMADMARPSNYREARCSAEEFLERRRSLLNQATRDTDGTPFKQ